MSVFQSITLQTNVAFSALEQFDVVSLVRLPLLGHLNNVWIFLVLAAIMILMLQLALQSGYLTSAVFAAIAIIRFLEQLFNENISLKKNIYFWGLSALFVFILSSNFLGLIPFGLTLTSFLLITFFFSSISFFSSVLISLYAHGLGFFGAFIPSGTPTALKAILIVIELISYTARLFSLAIRLFANMMSGHSLLKILTGFFLNFLTSFAAYGIPALILFIILAAITTLETVIAFLQAYVFLILTCIYTNEAIVGAH